MSDFRNMEEDLRTMQNMPECQLMKCINEVSFLVNDLQLYLDTHPDCQEGLRLMNRSLDRRERLLDIYAKKYGPLTMDSAGSSDEDQWKWMRQPFPWQQKGGNR